MTIPKCPKCDNTKFQITVDKSVKGAAYAITLVHCAACGCVVGTMEPLSISAYVDEIAKKLGVRMG